MLNREEYNATFHVDLTAEEFASLKPIVLGGDNIKDVESITAVIPDTLERVEFVPVVRCKDCKYWNECGFGMRDDMCHCSRIDYWTNADFFCADGERRDDGQIQQSN